MKNRLLATLLLAAIGSGVVPGSCAELSLPAVIGDHMVLQRDRSVALWGWAAAGQAVSVSASWRDGLVTAVADMEGRWQCALRTPGAGGPHTLAFAAGKSRLEVRDVLVGEVWLCSGQSNMEWQLRAAENGAAEVAAAKFPMIRLFVVPNRISASAQKDCEGKWTECSPEAAAGASAVGYFFGRKLHQDLGVPVALIEADWGGTVVETWMSRQRLAEFSNFTNALVALDRDGAATHPNVPSVLYNGMIAPLVPFTLRGALWYQGESNRHDAALYARLFPALIRDWRQQWGKGVFPFYFVQIAPFNYGGDRGETAAVREAQLGALSVPATGMVVTTDIGNPADIHPDNKQEVGRRLALWALAETYGKFDIVCSGPIFTGMKIEGGALRLSFDHVGGGLELRDSPQGHFWVAGEDRQFARAEARVDGDTVVVKSAGVAHPVAVRFGWEPASAPNLFNQAGLPASPFRSDSWEVDLSPASGTGTK